MFSSTEDFESLGKENWTRGNSSNNEHEDTSAYITGRIINLVLFMAVSGFIAVQLCVYEHKIHKAKLAQQNAGVAFAKRFKPRNTWNGGKQAVKMRICSILCALTGTLMFASKLVFQILHLLPYELHFCAVMKNVIFVLMTWTLVFIFLLLWLRQRSFYVHPSMKHLTSSVTRFLSGLTVVLILATGIVVPALFGLARYFVVSTSGCHFVEDTYLAYLYLVVTALISIIFHGSLLYLFICPIIRHNTALAPTDNLSRSNPVGGLTPVIKRAVLVTAVCVVSDITIFISTPLLSSNEDIQTIIEDFIVLANIICMTLTFVNWKERLFPFVSKKVNAANHRMRPSVTTIQIA